ncbi:MAG: DNA-formamidopyrimidine glycosylase [Acholeplasmatales bacterium]|jgi:formamidopyrimidine-DNA glycosylase|nr:DNA-formamidopyrimidine glycosylase [Acholeplasmatales bacterium]
MPELPEVENVRLKLLNIIKNKTLLKIDIFSEHNLSNLLGTEVNEFNSLINSAITDILRYGKYLVFEFTSSSDTKYLVSHLGMSGKYYQNKVLDKHDHVVFYFEDDIYLSYNDVRKFGLLTIKTKEQLFTTNPLNLLAPDPFSISCEVFYNSLNKHHHEIKTLILDQHIISGIGNIYADEILYSCGISPLREGSKITLEESSSIISNAIKILSHSIKEGGSTIRDYNSLGIKGNYQNFLVVHTKENCPCIYCKNPIKKIKVGGRSTYYCEYCQK